MFASYIGGIFLQLTFALFMKELRKLLKEQTLELSACNQVWISVCDKCSLQTTMVTSQSCIVVFPEPNDVLLIVYHDRVVS